MKGIWAVILVALLWVSPALANWSVNYNVGVMGTPALTMKTRTNSGISTVIPGNTCDMSQVQGVGLEYRYKRIGITTDVSFNSFGSGHQPFPLVSNDPDWGTLAASRLSGNVYGFSLLIRYYHPLTEKISLFAGVGPGLIYSVIEGSDLHLGHAKAVAPMVVAEVGARVFILPDLSADLFCRYRYSHPSYEFNVGVAGHRCIWPLTITTSWAACGWPTTSN